MGGVSGESRSRGHRVHELADDLYRISWVVDDRRGRYLRSFSRTTNRAGAERFAERWGIEEGSCAWIVRDRG